MKTLIVVPRDGQSPILIEKDFGPPKPSENAVIRKAVRTLAEVPVYGTFTFDGKLMRKYPTGVRKARGRTPSKLQILPPHTQVS